MQLLSSSVQSHLYDRTFPSSREFLLGTAGLEHSPCSLCYLFICYIDLHWDIDDSPFRVVCCFVVSFNLFLYPPFCL